MVKREIVIDRVIRFYYRYIVNGYNGLKMLSAKNKIQIELINPYNNLPPNCKIIDRDTLRFIKYLRREGYRIEITPRNKHKVYYVIRKGLLDIGSEIFLIVIEKIALPVITGLITYWITNRREKYNKPSNLNLFIINQSSAGKLYYDSLGELISEAEYEKRLIELTGKFTKINNWENVNPPDPLRPMPIYLEHTNKIVGWGNLRIEERGVKITDGVIIDDETRDRIGSGDLKGFSVSGLVDKPKCSKCKKNYLYCNHDEGAIIDKILCYECSIVKEPVNPQCKIETITIHDNANRNK